VAKKFFLLFPLSFSIVLPSSVHPSFILKDSLIWIFKPLPVNRIWSPTFIPI